MQMPELDDIALLRQYAEENSETAFAELVARRVNLVYSTALRGVGNSHAAEEISQAVFIILARKAKSIGAKTVLSSWLYQTTRLTAANYLRKEIRRQNREQEAFMQSTLNESESGDWLQIAPILDEAISKLGARDRDAIVLRFFENKSGREIGDALRIDSSTAQKRVTRAIEKLRKFFSKRGLTLSATMIAGAISANSVHAAPVGLTKTISTVAIAKGATASTSILTLIKGALKIMAWTKMKTAIVVGAGVLLAGATTTVTVKEIQEHNLDNSWRTPIIDSSKLSRVSPQVRILPTKFHKEYGWARNNNPMKVFGIGQSLVQITGMAYGELSPTRIVVSGKVPETKYDFIANLPTGNAEALQRQLKRQFGLIGRMEMIETNVLLLQVKYPNADGLKPSVDEKTFMSSTKNKWTYRHFPLSALATQCEYELQIPVIDTTGLTDSYDFDLNWQWSSDGAVENENFKQALLDQLGLELVPTNMPIKMLVVEKSN